jgi:hypothetical protein
MPSAKNTVIRVDSRPEFKQHLDYLYARRSAIDVLIESLHAYEQFQLKTPRRRAPRRRGPSPLPG